MDQNPYQPPQSRIEYRDPLSGTRPVPVRRLIRFANQVQLQKIYVLPAFANSGIGSGLMRSAEAQIHGSPFVSAWLMVHEENRRAVAFYERFGYRVIGRDTHDFEDVRVPFCVMEKTYVTELSNAADSR